MGIREWLVSLGRQWAAEADRLDEWAAEHEHELGGQRVLDTANARLRAAWLRLGAAIAQR